MPASLTVLAGPLTGTRVDVEEVVEEVLVGSDPDCRLCLDLPGVSPIHARIWLDGDGVTVHDTRAPRGVFVNDTRVEGQAPLKDGDLLWLGVPGDEASVMIGCRLGSIGDFGAAPSVPVAAAAAPAIDEPAPVGTASEDFYFDAPLADLEPPVVVPPAPAPLPPLVFEPEPEPPPAVEAAADPLDDLSTLVGEPAQEFFVEPSGAPAEDSIFFGDDFGSPVPEPPPPAAPPAAPVAARPAPVAAAVPAPALPAEADAEFFVDEPAAPSAPTPPPAPPPRPAPPRAAAARPAAPPAPPAPPVERHAPPAERPARRPPGERPAPSARPAPRPAPSALSSPLVRFGAPAAVVLVLIGVGVFVALRSGSAPAIASVQPPRAGPGQTVVVQGSDFAPTAAGNVVRIAGKPARVLKAAPTVLEVEVPDVPGTPGRDTPAPVVVTVEGRESKPGSLAVYQAPRIHGISPTVAMPGDTVVLAGGGWSPGVSVKFGDHAATIVEVAPAAMKVTVPELEGPVGREYPVTVAMGADPSNAAPFVMGRLPLLSGTQPSSAAPGDVVTLTGRGFVPNAAANDVRVSGLRALVVSASNSELKIVVPRVSAGDVPLQVKVPGSDNIGQSALKVSALADPADFYFVAEPFEDAPGHEHAALATVLGPAFVLSASGGRTAAQRAVEAAERLNAAAATLRASVDADLRVRDAETNPRLVEASREAALFDVTTEDALGYEEDWTGLRGRGEPASRGRLAVWWGAVARDLVLLFARSERPHYAADIAPEGKVLQEIHQSARKTASIGVPREVFDALRPATREALKTVGLRIPPTVKEPGEPQTAASTAPTAAAGPKLEGRWSGVERDATGARRITAVFVPGGGNLTIERAIAITVPMIGVVDQRGTVRFSLHTGAGPRFYKGRWDGQKIVGTITADEAGTQDLGTFELGR